MAAKDIVEIIIAAALPLAIITVFAYSAWRESDASSTLKFLAVAILIPALIILALEQSLDRGAIGVLMGTIIGYALSRLGGADVGRTSDRRTRK